MNTSTTQQIQPGSLAKRMLIGGGIALAVISFFIFPTEKDPGWSEYWRVRPLIITPLAGAMGGLCFHLLDRFRVQGGWRRRAANIAGILIYIIGLWMGIVLGLDGTLWD